MVRDWLMAQMTAFNATKSWRALIPTQRLESASALKARIPMRTVQDAKRYRTKQGGVPFPAGKAIRMRTMGLDAMFRVNTVDATMNGATWSAIMKTPSLPTLPASVRTPKSALLLPTRSTIGAICALHVAQNLKNSAPNKIL